MNRCGTCTYWTPLVVISGFGECAAPEIVYGYGVSADQVPVNGAVTENDEGWGMRTRPEFGCVLHTPRAGTKEMKP